MPELPEVETIRRDLEPLLLNRVIKQVVVRDPFVLTGFKPNGRPKRKIDLKDFENKLRNQKISALLRRGKYLILELQPRGSLIVHLRMTGQLLWNQAGEKDRLRLVLNGATPLSFVDRRWFGEIRFSEDWQSEPDLMNLGPEPLGADFNLDGFARQLKARHAAIHAVLLNQKIVAGIGNIYAAEALFDSQILPFKSAHRLTKNQMERLMQSIRKVLSESIRHRGYSMSTYVDALGKKGRSQMFSKVYGKADLPCPLCFEPLKQRNIGGRSAVYCSSCQN